jgi:hypothetical protein
LYIVGAADGAATEGATEGAATDGATDGAADGAGVELPEHAPTTTAIAASVAMLRARLLRFMNRTPPSSDQGLSSGALAEPHHCVALA